MMTSALSARCADEEETGTGCADAELAAPAVLSAMALLKL
jgi:hypothetical protein